MFLYISCVGNALFLGGLVFTIGFDRTIALFSR
jgi:hypothetical protein